MEAVLKVGGGLAKRRGGDKHKEGALGVEGVVYSVCAWPQSYDHRPSHPFYAGTEHVGVSPTRQRGVLNLAIEFVISDAVPFVKAGFLLVSWGCGRSGGGVLGLSMAVVVCK